MKRNLIACLSACVVLASVGIGGCGDGGYSKDWGISPTDVFLDYGEISTLELAVPNTINDRQDLSDFMDYCVFYGDREQMQYAKVSEEYCALLKKDAYTEYRWAGQYGNLAHNFAIGYDDSRLDSGEFGILAGFLPYGFKEYSLKSDNVKVATFEYYTETLSGEENRGYTLSDFPLYRENNGFVEVQNSEQLFYAAARGYMPFVKDRESETGKLLSKALGILNSLMIEDMSTLEKYRAIYNYLICENTYDYDSFHFKDSEHTDYAAYFIDGVLNGKNAVCDGLVKTAVLLCRLEGIEAYHIGAVGNAGGHAYLYVNIDGTYYLSCPTQASSTIKIGDKRYHTHTYSFFLTDYETSSPAWDFASGQLPEIGELVKQTEKYDYWAENSLAPDSATEAVALLREAGKTAEKSGAAIQIELSTSFSVADEAYRTIEKEFSVTKINNGMFKERKLYAFLFEG